MSEDLISFKTAKLAKIKGFVDIIFYSNGQGELSGEIYSGPSQSVLRKWLREKHEIDLFMDIWGKEGEFYHIEDITKGFGKDRHVIGNGGEGSLNYEEALEEGLLEALKLIKL